MQSVILLNCSIAHDENSQLSLNVTVHESTARNIAYISLFWTVLPYQKLWQPSWTA